MLSGMDSFLVSFFIWCVFLCHCTAVRGVPDVNHVRHDCQGNSIPGSNYYEARDTAVSHVIMLAGTRGNFYFEEITVGASTCYARGSCTFSIPAQDCEVCLGVADNLVAEMCGFPVNATMVLADCVLRFNS